MWTRQAELTASLMLTDVPVPGGAEGWQEPKFCKLQRLPGKPVGTKHSGGKTMWKNSLKSVLIDTCVQLVGQTYVRAFLANETEQQVPVFLRNVGSAA